MGQPGNPKPTARFLVNPLPRSLCLTIAFLLIPFVMVYAVARLLLTAPGEWMDFVAEALDE
jgi:hypothetical protein